jgi:hypothetical protein
MILLLELVDRSTYYQNIITPPYARPVDRTCFG